MAILKVDAQLNFKQIQDLAKLYPEINGRFLSLVGSRSRTLLKLIALSKGVRLSDNKRGAKGQFIVTSDVNKKRNQVKIYSFPLMLFENGRLLRDGSTEAGRKMFPELKMQVMSKMGVYISEFENKMINPELRKIGL